MYGDGGGGVPNLEVTNAFQSPTAAISGTHSPHLATASCLQCSFAVVAVVAFAFDFFLAVVLFSNIVRAFSNHSREVYNSYTVELLRLVVSLSLLLSSSSPALDEYFLSFS